MNDSPQQSRTKTTYWWVLVFAILMWTAKTNFQLATFLAFFGTVILLGHYFRKSRPRDAISLALGTTLAFIIMMVAFTSHRPPTTSPPIADAAITQSTNSTVSTTTRPQSPLPANTSKPLYASERAAIARSERTSVEALIAEAQALYDRASTFPDNVSVARSRDPAYYADERHFQNETIAQKNIMEFVDPNALSASIAIAGADPWLYRAAVDAFASCNAHDSALELKVAKAFIQQARREIDGIASDDWDPPDITDQLNNQDRCQDNVNP